MKPNPKQATAVLFTDGIALSCFTKAGTCQIAFVRHEHHDFSVDILEVDDATNTSVPVSHNLDLGNGQSIVLEAINPVYGNSTSYEADGGFDRRTHQDEKDFRWVVDLEGEMHGRKLNLNSPASQSSSPVTLLTVNHANFYTETLFKYEVLKIRRGDTSGVEFGRIADVVAADIFCQEGRGSGIRLSNKGGQNEKFLEKKPCIRYEIHFKNVRPEHMHSQSKDEVAEDVPHDSDFTLYYDIVKDPSHMEYDLKVIPSVLTSKNDPCNRARVGVTDNLSALTGG